MPNRCLVTVMALAIISAGDLRAFQRPPQRCDQFESALRADPSNLDAAARLGRCSVRDYEMIAPGGDSAHLVFRASWSTALRALRHSVEVNGSYANAYQPLFTILFAETRDGCSWVTGKCEYVAPVVRDGDSILTVPRLVVVNGPDDPYAEVVRETRASWKPNLMEARTLAERWAAAAPNDRRPHEYLGQALLRLEDPEAATAELERAATLGTPASRRALFWERMEALVKSNRGDDARRVLDEAAADPARDTTRLRNFTLTNLNALLGRNRPPPEDTSPRTRELRAQQRARTDSIIRTLPAPPRRPPSVAELLAAGDTSGARKEVARQDSLMAPIAGMRRFPSANEGTLYSAQQHLAIGDTAGAEARLAEIERPFNDRPFQYRVPAIAGWSPWLGRAWLLTGDVAAARGHREEASRMYRRVVGLWGGGDANLKPVVDQARARLVSVQGR
jgi:tetratricopeptide (TPR) repeat protein